ncbi:MAG: hypothetical protein U0984_20110 [Prosthecobacter sp.]|nr:hypothetical protein [Prosthecobacter sp.]
MNEAGTTQLDRKTGTPRWAKLVMAFATGLLLLVLALGFQSVTLAKGGYVNVLIIALILTALADSCFIYTFLRGGVISRVLSVACLLPTLFIISDFLRRAPGLFTN